MPFSGVILVSILWHNGVDSVTLWQRLTLLYGDYIKPRRNLADSGTYYRVHVSKSQLLSHE